MHRLELNDEEIGLLRLLLEFHADDPPGEYYDDGAYEALCAKAGVEVRPQTVLAEPPRSF